MPVLVPTGTYTVPDGYAVPGANPWAGSLSAGDELSFFVGSAQKNPTSTHVDYDVFISDLAGPTVVYELSPLWTAVAVTGTFVIPANATYGLFLQEGGGAAGAAGGTIFNFQMSVAYATPGFNPPDSAALAQLQNELAPYSLVRGQVHRGVVQGSNLTLATNTVALYWSFAQLPPSVPSSGGNPNYYYNFGFATPLQTFGFSKSTRVSFNPQLMWLPPVTTSVSFFLPIGLVLDVTEMAAGAGLTGVPPV